MRKKRKFLAPLAVSVAALTVSLPSSALIDQHHSQTVVAVSNAASGSAAIDDPFVILRNGYNEVLTT